MNNKDMERSAYKNWFDSTFNNIEKETLSKLKVECCSDHQFFKYQLLDIARHLENYKLKKEIDLYDKFIDRYIELIPKYLHSQINKERLKEDKYYLAWFFNRYCFFEVIKDAQDNFKNSNGAYEHVLWSPLIDKLTPNECREFENKVYHCMDEVFLNSAVDHWASVRDGCRCSLILRKAP